MPGLRHEELRVFGHRLLHQMGFTTNAIHNEYQLSVMTPSGRRQYRIDLAGVSKPNIVLIEIGGNQYEKIHNLRTAGYLVIVIPYTEDHTVFEDDARLLQLMIEGNEELVARIGAAWELHRKAYEELMEVRRTELDRAHKESHLLREDLQKVTAALIAFKNTAALIELPQPPKTIPALRPEIDHNAGNRQ